MRSRAPLLGLAKYIYYRYSLQILRDWLSVPYLNTKTVHVKLSFLDNLEIDFNLLHPVLNAFVSWNAGKVPNFSTSARGTKWRLAS